MKKLLLGLLVVASMLFVTPAFADIFGNTSKDIVKVGPQTEKIEKLSPTDFIGTLQNLINYLGVRDGSAYDFKQHEFVNQIGATIITKWNIAADVSMLNADGVALTLDYNLGAVLPVESVPVMKYLKYLYVGGGYGYRNDDSEGGWYGTPLVDAQFKFDF